MQKEEYPSISRFLKKWLPLILVVSVLALLANSSMITIRSGYVGLLERGGKIQTPALKEGQHLKIPFLDRIHFFETRLKPIYAKADGLSKDNIPFTIEVQQLIGVKADKVDELFLNYGRPKDLIKGLLVPALQHAAQTTASSYELTEIYSNQENIRAQIEEAANLAFTKTAIRDTAEEAYFNLGALSISRITLAKEIKKALSKSAIQPWLTDSNTASPTTASSTEKTVAPVPSE